jgi:glycosyltransferase involved in cell wall biosynthesis
MGVSDVDAEDSGTESNGETIAADAHGNSVDLPIERPLVILQLTPTLNSGGVERGTIDIARAITAAGGRALVATAGVRNALRLARIVRAEGVDVIHARSRAPAWAGLLAAKWTGCAFVTTYHGAYRENAPFKRLYNSVMARGRPTIAVSEFIAALIRSRHPRAEIVTIPRGADLAVFDEERVSAERTIAAARAWGVVEDTRPIILLPGRLTRWKGQEHMIDAAAILRAQRGAADFLVALVGGDFDSPFAHELEARIKRAGLADCVRLVGHCDDMAAAYKLAAVVVSASTEPEAFGRVAIEAQAMGRPIVATAHGGALETVEDGRSGWLYPPGDAAALAEKLNAALSLDESARAHMGLAGKARVATRFSLATMGRDTLEIYRRAAGR